jgi:predicted dehydrogenase
VSDRLSAAVVGAGAIGALLDDSGITEQTEPLTHAGGYVAAGYALVAMADTEPQVREKSRRWGCEVFADFDAMMRAEKPDVISFAVPAHARPALIRHALAYAPRAIVAEKPLAPTVAEAEEIVAACRDASVPLLVNYTRRFVPFWQRLAQVTAKSATSGDIISATIRYAKGLRHNGTHAIDLCRMLFGECLQARPLASKYDHWDDDPTVSAHLGFERCPEVFLQGLDERCFTLFEVDIFAAQWRVIVDNDGRRARRFELSRDTGIPRGKRLVEEPWEDTGAAFAMLNLMRHVQDVAAGAKPLCSGEDALEAQRVAARLTA